eukprot:TRINITY_DN10774_c0_g1_i1.p1 TRINITY_DN10774_c0_g1~~TRINITY_DN10774_c0_g1_i1.p1  ORF type:complete len:207 (+),score=28.65 TRINITY_DN10774_c0_g1_i1:62-682(+)
MLHVCDFDGSYVYGRLFNYGIGIHLLKAECPIPRADAERPINPKADHISFQCEDMEVVEQRLKDFGICFLRQVVQEGGILVDQLFFHDPDGHMIEICNCQLLPIVPLSGSPCLPCALRQISPGESPLLPMPKKISSCRSVQAGRIGSASLASAGRSWSGKLLPRWSDSDSGYLASSWPGNLERGELTEDSLSRGETGKEGGMEAVL